MSQSDTPEADSDLSGHDAIPITLIPSGTSSDASSDALSGLGEFAENWADACGFTGALGQALRVPDAEGRLDQILFGWGDEATRKRDRFYLGDLARSAQPGTYRLATDLDPESAHLAALGWLLGRYRFDKYKTRDADTNADLLAPDNVDPVRLIQIVEGVFLTRDLINVPANDMGPAALEATCRKLADRHGADLEVTTGDELLEQNFPLIHTVGRAASQAPRLMDMVWGDDDAPKITLVGKGVCFDTGGLNIKPGQSMGLMKKDMGGAATVLGLAHMIMAADLPIRLRVLIPAVENGISAGAMRPGDVLTSRLGKTVEVNNTDAEGRLVLADALALAAEENPDLIVDMATLTGAARVALGPEVVPFYTANDELALTLSDASKQVADPLWRMPLWPGYERDIEPDIADLDNAPKGGFAGSITAALFLQRFVGDCEWVHFDIYGWTPSARPGRPTGGECQAARALFHMLDAQYGDVG